MGPSDKDFESLNPKVPNVPLTPPQTEEASQDLQTRCPKGLLAPSVKDKDLGYHTPHGTNPPRPPGRRV